MHRGVRRREALKLAKTSARIVANAQEEASRRKHAEVGAEHLLWAILGHGAAWRVKLPPPCRAELRAFMEQSLDSLAAANAYRDATPPALAKEVVDALRPSRWTVFERPLTPKDLTLRVAIIPRVRDWFVWASLDDLLVDDAIDEASEIAAQRGHLAIEITHVLRVIADQHWLGAPASLASALDAMLGGAATPSEPSMSEALALLVQSTKVHARMAKRAPTCDMLLCLALRDDAIRASFDAAGIAVDPLLQRLAHGDNDQGEPPDSAMVDVVFHHDDFTPVELVRELVAERFRLGAREAKLALEIAQDEGEVVVGSLPAEEARALVAELLEHTSRARLPLRITQRAR